MAFNRLNSELQQQVAQMREALILAQKYGVSDQRIIRAIAAALAASIALAHPGDPEI